MRGRVVFALFTAGLRGLGDTRGTRHRREICQWEERVSTCVDATPESIDLRANLASENRQHGDRY